MSEQVTLQEFTDWMQKLFVSTGEEKQIAITEIDNGDGTWSGVDKDGNVRCIYGPKTREALVRYRETHDEFEDALTSASIASAIKAEKTQKHLALEMREDDTDAYFEIRRRDRNPSF